MGFKNVKQNIRILVITGILLSIFTMFGCIVGDDGEDTVTPDYTNPGLPLTENQNWTIIYYSDADNDLEEYLMRDLNEMESVDMSGKKIKIIALVDRNPNYWAGDGNWSDSRVYEIEYDSAGYNSTLVSKRVAVETLGISRNLSTGEVNMGDALTLKKFIQFCKSNYPADNYALILSNHGGGPKKKSSSLSSETSSIDSSSMIAKSICWDETSGNDFLYTAEISDVLTSAESVHLFGLDACLMSSVEFAYQFRNDSSNTGFKAEIMVASAPNETGNGWDYDSILARIKSGGGNNGTADITIGGNELYYDPSTLTAEQLGAIIVEEQRDSTTGIYDTAQSLTCLDLSKIKAVKDAVDVLAVSITGNKTELETLRGNYPNANLLHYFDKTKSSEWLSYPFFDLYNLSEAINASLSFSGTIQGNAATVRSAVDALVLYSFANSAFSSVNSKLNFVPDKSGVHIFFTDGDAQAIAALDIIGDAALDDVNLWYWQDWYNSKTAAEQRLIYPSYTSAPYGNLAWCKDGINTTANIVGNWFELLDSWYDTQWGNNANGGFNAFQW